MPLYTYNGALLQANGGLAATDKLCCGACCIDGQCYDKNKCDCEAAGGTWHAGQSCGDASFSCGSSSSSSSSESSSSYDSSSSYSYSSDYGACCIAVQGPPTYSSSCTTEYSPGGGDPVTTCEEVTVPGEVKYTCTTGTQYECYIIGGVFYQGKNCGQIWCGGSSGTSSGTNSSSSSNTKPSRSSGWVCKPVWACKPKEECQEAADCPCDTVPGWSEGGANNCCPPGSTWNAEEEICEAPDAITGGEPKSEIVTCCAGTCCPATPGCCGNKCLPEGKECCNGEIRDPETDTGCCFTNNGPVPATRAECEAIAAQENAAIVWDPCDCPCNDDDCEWVYNRDTQTWRLGDPDGIAIQAACAADGTCDCPEPTHNPAEGEPIVVYIPCLKQQAAQQLRTINTNPTTVYICDD